MVEKTTDEIRMEKITISKRDYNDLMIMLAESRNRIQRVARHATMQADRWCKNVTMAMAEIEKKYK